MRALASLAAGAVLAFAVAFAVGAATAPAPDTAPNDGTRIMFVGDSITGSPGCWRAPVWVSLTDDGYAVDMVGIRTANECGDVANAAGVAWDPDNTGIGGITTAGMWIKLARDEVLAATAPDVIVMLLGTNDLLGGATPDAILDQYNKQLALYRDYDPNIRVVVGTPTPISEGKCGCDAAQAALAAALPAWGAGASTAASPVLVADLSTGYDVDTDTLDGIHPNDAGNAKLAAAWNPVIEALLDTAPVSPSASASASPSASPSTSPSPSMSTGVMPSADAEPPAPPSQWVIIGIVLAATLAVGVAAVVRRRS